MEIDSVITKEYKTRKEELEEILGPGGKLNSDIYETVIRIRNAKTEEEVEKNLCSLDKAINSYLKYAIEYDRLERDNKTTKTKTRKYKTMKERVFAEKSTYEIPEGGGVMFKYSIKYQNGKYISAAIAECWDMEIAKAIGKAVAELMLIVNHDKPIQHFSDRSSTEVEVWYRD